MKGASGGGGDGGRGDGGRTRPTGNGNGNMVCSNNAIYVCMCICKSTGHDQYHVQTFTDRNKSDPNIIWQILADLGRI